MGGADFLRTTSHSDLNGLRAAGSLGCVHVALHVSIYCCRCVAAAGRGNSGAHSQAATLAWLRLPAGLSAAAEQQPAALRSEEWDAAAGAPEPAPLVH